jgi:Fe-S-cluster containining protein
MSNYGAIRRLYDTLPKLSCKGLCHDSCGPIASSPAEAAVLKRKGVDLPKMEELPGLMLRVLDGADVRCSGLTEDKKCSVYEHRPMICRLWGSVLNPRMMCPHGCEPERWVSDEEAGELLKRVSKLGS